MINSSEPFGKFRQASDHALSSSPGQRTVAGTRVKVLTTKVGLQIPKDLPFDEWERAGHQLLAIIDSSSWWLGDWLAYGKDHFTDRYQMALRAVGLSYQTLRNYSWVGTGTLADQVAVEALSGWDYEQLDTVFIPAQIPDDPIEAVITAVVEQQTAANVYVVGSGWGDGVYATYVGRTEDGRITSFVTDFRVVPLG